MHIYIYVKMNTIFSNLIDLRVLLDGAPDHVIMKMSESFPSYKENDDVDILCSNISQMLTHVYGASDAYFKAGYRISIQKIGLHTHIDFYAPMMAHLNVRLDLLETLSGYKNFYIDPSYHEVVLQTKMQVRQAGGVYWVPRLDHDLAIRCLEYLEWRDVNPAKVKHLNYVVSKNDASFMRIIEKYTNLVLPEASAHKAKHESMPTSAGHRMDFLMIWGHGLEHTEAILDMVRDQSDLEIVTIVKRAISDISKFVQDVYASDTVPFEHLRSKTKYLVTTPSQIVFVLLRNTRPQEKFFGEGAFRHIQCQLIKDLKESIRSRFNPRLITGERSEAHVVHASDYQSQVVHMLKVLGLPALDVYERSSSDDIDLPYHLAHLQLERTQDVDMNRLYASVLGKGLVPLVETPHFQYVTGSKEVYLAYHAQSAGLMLTDDHYPNAFDRLIVDLRYGDRVKHGKRSIIFVKPLEGGHYQILDGVHRAAILAARGVRSILVALASPH